ncbi:MAG: amidohydrolase family protein [Spirochaetales bacterium]|jgi:imidazolonepropionase-like amidohydrolase|nr:amidohydrolase family protein [Spirochaetales bacterium]
MKAIHADLLYTGKDMKRDVYLIYTGKTITGIQKSWTGKVEKSYPVVTPAFIDPHAHIGLVRAGEPAAEAEANDQMDSFIIHADALDSVQMDDEAFTDSIEAGVLYSCVVPGSANIIGGKSAVIRNYGQNSSKALIDRAGIKAAIGYNPMSPGVRGWKGSRPYTRMGTFALLRGKLHDTKDKMKKKKDPTELIGAEEEMLRRILKGLERLRVHVHKIDDIATLLRLVDEFKLKVTVEHTCDVNDADIYRELKKRNIQVVYGPLDALAYKVELKHENWRNLRSLIDSGVTFGLMTDHPVILQRTLLLTLRWFLRCGITKQQALEIITRQNAKVLGIDKYLGTLEKGKWASFVCWNGDPFDLASFPEEVVGEGETLSIRS